MEVTGGEEIVKVHDGVNQRVEEGSEAALSPAHEPGSPPAEPGQSAVVDDVERREVGELLTGNKEEGVSQVNKLWKSERECKVLLTIIILALEK